METWIQTILFKLQKSKINQSCNIAQYSATTLKHDVISQAQYFHMYGLTNYSVKLRSQLQYKCYFCYLWPENNFYLKTLSLEK